MDQRVSVKFCVKNIIKCFKALEIFTVAFDESTLPQKSIYKWYKCFTEDRKDVDDDEHPGKLFLKVVDSLFKKLQRLLKYQSAHTIQFSRMFWA